MGQIRHVTGNLFSSSDPIIAHGVNCRGAFGSGVAGQVARLFPEVRDAYMFKFHRTGWSPGQVQFVNVPGTDPPLVVANMSCQDTYGGLGDHVDYDAVYLCFAQVLAYAENNGWCLSIPKVGAGLAGGNWPRIETIIRDLVSRRSVRVTCYSLE